MLEACGVQNSFLLDSFLKGYWNRLYREFVFAGADSGGRIVLSSRQVRPTHNL
jgi:hypothetical protein